MREDDKRSRYSVLNVLQRQYYYYEKYTPLFAVVLWLADALFCFVIINYVSYTEIDWVAYMQQIKQIEHGELDYLKIEGGTGPLVYPAGHVWIFRTLYYLTDEGSNVVRAQYIFMALYLLTLALVLRLYVKAKVPPYILPLLILSKRLHSIYLLRLFNDCFGTLAAVIAVSLIQSRKWALSAVLFSIGISIKMNGLLFLPGAGIIYLHSLGFFKALLLAIPMGLVQIITAYPFLLYDPASYMAGAFEFSRAFLYEWTVNWKFVDAKTFSSHQFSILLLTLHITLLTAFCIKWWRINTRLLLNNPQKLVQIAAISNLIGVLCARSLHYQFYSWFQWTIPFLLYTSSIPLDISYIIYFAQEYAWNVFPSTPVSSAIVVASMALIIVSNY